MTAFGKEFREKYFPTGPQTVPINHGSYGLVPTPVIKKFHEHLDEDLAFPDKYIVFDYTPQLKANIARVAQLVDADPLDLVFCNNASTGVNTVLRSYPFQKGDKILMPSTVYDACGNTVKFLKNRYGIEILTLDLPYPLSDDEVVSKFKEVFEAEESNGNPVKLALFDTVVSMPGLRIPFERLIKLCKDHNVLSMVDGAHSIGLVKLSLKTLEPDFYTTNLHKWLYVPRGCALLYVNKKHHRSIHTFPVSHSYLADDEPLEETLEQSRLVDRFAFVGSSSFASFVSAIDAIEFRENVCGGEDAIADYCLRTAKEGGAKIAELWGTKVLENKEGSLTTSMVNVEAPIPSDLKEDFLRLCKTPKFVEKMRAYVDRIQVEEFHTYLPCCYHNGALWCRFSAQVYVDVDDFVYAANSFRKAFNRYLESDTFKVLLN
ncbi:unnamed protein product [Kuraishia capsulata CBS 1993]|uniref:Aminotransferase class V domain-containing protein n=1 Tax=Kuraishia capsulata CBS 1993 TaxID=1382522 RepID=W6MK23_9ASCO|nr:uncharacterized protein KUCA_T00002309001 [Kuraishia capsulata CBS 1993]CDK26338.1 unnamed protein product [Kuraishia capsulata CBS 1993]